jgi:hypothetical protein
MVKLKHLKAYDRNTIPEHIVQEVDDLIEKLAVAVAPFVVSIDSNIILSAFNRLHAGIIVTLISEKHEEIRNATLQEVKGLIGNVEDITGVKILKDEEPNK